LSFNLPEAIFIELISDEFDYLMTFFKVVPHTIRAHIEVTILHPHLFVYL
jgi:hypothetical protein